MSKRIKIEVVALIFLILGSTATIFFWKPDIGTPVATDLGSTPVVEKIEPRPATEESGEEAKPKEWSPVIWGLISIGLIAGFWWFTRRKHKINLTQKASDAGGQIGKLAVASGRWLIHLGTPLVVLLGFGLVISLIALYLPSLWEWIKIQKTFWALVILLPILVAVAVKYSPCWWLVLITVIVCAIATEDGSYPRMEYWRLESLAKVEEAEVAKKARETKLEQAMAIVNATPTHKQTVIAPAETWSERVSIPLGRVANIRPQGKVIVRTASGKSWEDWPGRVGEIFKPHSPLDQMFQFKASENKPVEVVVEWQPK